MRKILTLIAILLITTLVLTGCGFSSWQDEESVKTIKEINRVTDTEGNVYIEIVYTDDSPKDRFLIPEGVSITGVESNYDSDARETLVTINFSDNFPAFNFSVPDGKDGSSVNAVEITEKEGLRYLSFKYVDGEGNELNSWDVNIDEFRGDDGKDGATWLFGEGDPNEAKEPVVGKPGDFFLDTVDYVVYVKKADTWEKMGTIKGTGILDIHSFDEGAGIEIVTSEIETDVDGNPKFDSAGQPVYRTYKLYSSAVNDMKVEFNRETGMYEFLISVTDAMGNVKELENLIQVQRPATWLSGLVRPDDNDDITGELTFDGDFYYSTKYNEIWTKKDDEWMLLVKIAADQEIVYRSVTFMPEGGTLSKDPNAYPNPIPNENPFNEDGSVTVKVEKGTCYPSQCEIPVPVRDGYVFKGWYKRKSDSLTPNDGVFNTMVPVYDNMTLYALWEAVA